MSPRTLDLALVLTCTAVLSGRSQPQNFGPPITSRVGSGQFTSAALVDVDRDGDSDLLFCEASLLRGRLVLARNDGTGVFRLGGSVDGNFPAFSLEAFDADADGDIDVALSGFNLAIRRGDGQGGFPQFQAFMNLSAQALQSADIDGDGRCDLLALDLSVNVMRNYGNASFHAPTVIQLGLGVSPVSIGIADLELDGDLDALIPASLNGVGRLHVLRNRGGGRLPILEAAVPLPAPPMASVRQDAHLADFDGDRFPDLAMMAVGSPTLHILRGGPFGFASSTSTPAPASSTIVAVVDLDGDGSCDVVLSNPNASTIDVLRGRGDATFAGAATLLGGVTDFVVLIGDVNADGAPDLVTVGPNTRVYPQIHASTVRLIFHWCSNRC